jgi:HEAT repeat protein
MSSLPRARNLRAHMRPLASVILAAALCLPAAEGGDPNFPSDDVARANLAEAVQQYRAGRYAEAALAFQTALKQDPSNKLVYEFYLACGDALVVRMQERDVLTDVLKDVLRRARIYQKQLRRDPAYINLLITKLDGGDEERLVASHELAAVGPLAVPHLLAAMVDNPQEDRRTYCRVVLTKMGTRAVLPLAAALKTSDQRQMRSIALLLADIGDPRALPALVRAQAGTSNEDTTKAALQTSIEAIAGRSQMASVGAGDQLYLTEALRVFRGGPQVQDESEANESLVWRWDDTQQGAAKLAAVRTPRYAWNEQVAEQLLFDGMEAYPAFAGYQPALAAVYAAQQVEAEVRARLAKERTAPADSPDDTADAIAARIAALTEVGARVQMVGAENLCRGVQLALGAERNDVAIHLMRVLQDRELARPESTLPRTGLSADTAGSVLVAALDHPSRAVRYQAAMTLAYLDPSGGATVDVGNASALVGQVQSALAAGDEKRAGELAEQLAKALRDSGVRGGYAGTDKVVPMLSEAIGEWGMRVVLVIDPDYRQRNIARERLQAKGYLVVTAADGFEAFQRLSESPAKDAIIVAGDLRPSLKDEHGVLLDAPEQTTMGLVAKIAADWRSQGRPIFVSLPDDPARAAQVQTALDGKLPEGTGFVAKPFDSVELHEKIDAALKDKPLINLNREESEEISRRACQALQAPDPLRSVYNLPAAAEALVTTLEARADGIRIEALKALGRAADAPRGDLVKALLPRITAVYIAQDGELETRPALRAAFVYAIGKLNPADEAAVGILKKALTHSELTVRTAAAQAVGHGVNLPPELLGILQTQQRIDARAAGAGAEQ